MVKNVEFLSMNSTRPVLVAMSSRHSSSWLGPVRKLLPAALVTLVTSWHRQITLRKSRIVESELPPDCMNFLHCCSNVASIPATPLPLLSDSDAVNKGVGPITLESSGL